MAVADGAQATDGLVVRQVPAARCVVCECTVKTIGEASDYLYGEWLPASPYDCDFSTPDFEYYAPESTTSDSAVFIYLPLKEKKG